MTVIPNAQKITLDNGVRLVTENIPALRSVTMGIMVGAGSANETDQEAGISHLIEHLCFKGTKKRSAFDIAHALDAVGGRMNAYTTKEYTLYYAVVLDKHINTAVDVLCDFFLNSLFAPDAIEMEKGVILEEIKMYEDSPNELIHDFFAEKILSGHPIGRPTIGSNETVSSFTQEDIKKFRQKWYTPANTIISLAGAIPDRVTDLLKPYLENWSSKNTPLQLPKSEIRGGIYLKKKQVEQVHLCLGVKGVTQVEADRYPYAVLDNILGGSMSSRLFQEIREKRGLVYSVFSTSSPFRDLGLSYVYAGTSKENMAQVIELILKEFSAIKENGVTSEELERARESLKGTLVLGLESTSSRMSWLAKTEFYYGRNQTIDEVFAQIDKITLDDIVRLANKFFRNEYLTLAVIADMEELPVKELHC